MVANFDLLPNFINALETLLAARDIVIFFATVWVLPIADTACVSGDAILPNLLKILFAVDDAVSAFCQTQLLVNITSQHHK